MAICGRSADDVKSAVGDLGAQRDGRIFGGSADVSKLESVKSFFRSVDEQFNGLDILINNAGVGLFRSVAEIEPDEWRRIIDVNLNGAYYCSHEALQRFKQRGGGYIINISSLAGKNPFAGGAAYNASKFALNGFSEAMMLDHRYDNIRVSYVMPGSVDTSFNPQVPPSPWKIAPQDVAEIVSLLLRMPERTLVSRIEVRPSKPPK